eukprot:s1657_g12.t1
MWQAWRLRHWAGSGGGLVRRWVRVAPRLFCMAGVALGDICLRFVRQAWHLVTWLALAAALVAAGSVWRRASFAWQAWHLATSGVALGDICLRFVWQAALTALGWLWWRPWSPLGPCATAPLLHGRRGTWRHLLPFCVAGVALGDICFRFVWQAWHLRVTRPRPPPERRRWVRVAPRLFCMAGVALGDICLRFVWHAGVALGDICLRFVWQAWHLRHWAGSGGGLGRRWVRVAPRLFCMTGVALGDICLRFVRPWRDWAVSGGGLGRRWVRVTPRLFCMAGGTWRHLPSFCVAGVALGDICLRFVAGGTYGAGVALVAALVAAGSVWRHASFA